MKTRVKNDRLMYRPFLLATIVFGLSLQAFAQVVFVTPSGAGDHSGLSWDNAKTFQEAAVSPAGEMWLKAGIYDDQFSYNPPTRTSLSMYGGFIGTETQREQRDPIQNRTQIQNFFEINFVGNISKTFDGITVKNSRFLTSGAVSLTEIGTTSISNCIFDNCAVKSNKPYKSYNGDIFTDCIFKNWNGVGSAFTVFDGVAGVERCLFKDNTNLGTLDSERGGGAVFVVNSFGTAYAGNLTSTYVGFRSCVFDNNSTPAGFGGAMALVHPSTVTVDNCLFKNNSAAFGGAVYGTDFSVSRNTAQGGILNFYNNTFAGNSSTNGGTAVCFRSGSSSYLFTQNIVWGNTGTGSWLHTVIPSPCVGSIITRNIIQESVHTCADSSTTMNLVSDPFLNADFTPSACSPAINYGRPVYGHYDPTDLAGNPRTMSSNKDAGCYEWLGSDPADATWYKDADSDQYSDGTTVIQCARPTGYKLASELAALSGDCNDADASVHEPIPYYTDGDGDGYGSNSMDSLCVSTAPVGYATNNTDCNDGDAGVWQTASFYMDGDGDGYHRTDLYGNDLKEEICYGAIIPGGYRLSTNGTDCNDTDASVYIPIQYYIDADGDGYGSTTTVMLCSSITATGYASNNTDCNDADAAVHEPIQYYVDADGDGFGSTTTEAFCSSTAPTGYVTNSDDGNDDNQAVQGGPGMMIFVRVSSTGNVFTLDGIASSGYIINIKRLIKDLSGFPLADQVLIFNGTQLQDANTLGDYNIQKEATLFLYLPRTWYLDADGDGHYVSTVESNLSPGAGYTDVQGGTFGDCDDTDANVYQTLNLYADVDGDGYESGAGLQPVCMGDFTPFGYSNFTLGVDCNDNNTSINPEAAEICDGIDNNCDGIIDSNPLPVISGNTPFCQGSAITMDAGAGYASYSWSTGETTRTISVNNSNPVSVTVTNQFGCSAMSALVTPTLNTVSTAPTSITSSVALATPGTNFTLSVNGGLLGTGASWKWYTNSCGGTLVGTGASISVSQNVNTTYYVRAEGTCNPTACASISILSQCGATAIVSSAGNASICAGSPVTFTVIGSLSPGAQWRWDDDCDAVPLTTDASATYTSASTFTVYPTCNTTYYLQSVGGACGVTVCVPVTVNVLSKPATPGTISGSAAICPKSSVTYSIEAVSGATSYTWTAPSNGTLISPQGSTSMTVSYASTFTSGTLKVKASNCSGTSSDKSLTLSKAAVPATPGTISGASPVCAGSTQTYSISAVANASSYTWTLPTGMGFMAGTSITGTSVQVVLASNFASGTISVKANNCAGSSALKTKAITGTPLPTQASTISGVTSLCNGSKSNVFSVTAATGFTFNWTVPTGCSITSGQGTNSIKVTWGTTSGTVAVTKNNGCGVSLPSTKAVSSLACREAVDEVAETEQMSLYPNPAVNSATLNFSSAKEGDYQIRVINALGQLVYSSEGKASEGANTIELNLEKLSSGMYIVQLVRNGNRQQVNLIKK